MRTDDQIRRVQAFLDELSELSRGHRILVTGCNCRGSPWLVTDPDKWESMGSAESGPPDGHYLVALAEIVNRRGERNDFAELE